MLFLHRIKYVMQMLLAKNKERKRKKVNQIKYRLLNDEYLCKINSHNH